MGAATASHSSHQNIAQVFMSKRDAFLQLLQKKAPRFSLPSVFSSPHLNCHSPPPYFMVGRKTKQNKKKKGKNKNQALTSMPSHLHSLSTRDCFGNTAMHAHKRRSCKGWVPFVKVEDWCTSLSEQPVSKHLPPDCFFFPHVSFFFFCYFMFVCFFKLFALQC